ncbi:MAG: hypothetical protein IPH57_12365 [Saprospiraceae bacterium]|nr:hypothetical protein [Saprospiraceae bacterium]
MLISVFKRNLFVNSLLLLPLTALVRVFSLIFHEKIETNKEGGILYEFVIDILPENSLLYSFISIFIVFFTAVLINRLVIKNRIANEITLLPGLFFILMVSLSPEMLGLSSLQFGLLFIILGFISLFKSYKKYSSEMLLFNTGFYIGIASLFCNNLVVFIIPVLFGYISIRSFNFRELFQLFSGLILIVYFYTFYLFWAGESFAFSPFTYNSIKDVYSGNISIKIILTIYLALTLVLLFTYRSFIIKKSIQSQKKINILLWYLILTFLLIWIFDQVFWFGYFYLIAFGLSYFTSAIFLRLKNKMISEIVYVIIVFSILIYQFIFYF